MRKVNHLISSLFLPMLVLMLSTGFVMAQTTISGKVTDAGTGESIIGASVLVVGTTTGALTDIDGSYTLAVPEGATTLRFSYVGYPTQEVEIAGRTTIDVQLTEGTELDEVVVVGYGTQTKKEVTSAVANVEAKDFNGGNVNDAAQLLQGKVSGLTIARPGGDPNGGFNIRLRGLSTIGANTQPLIVIDGVPGASLQSVDPNDIESMSVLKDGSAAAIYGTRGSSGVILITTKKGREGDAKVEYNGYVTNESIAKTVPVMSASEYRSFVGGTNGQFTGTDLGSNTDWFGEITRPATSHVHNLSLSGGNAKTTYRASFNYRDAQGVAIKTGFDQLNARLNLTQKAFDERLAITMNLASTTRRSEFGFNEAFRYATIFNPTAPILDEADQVNGGYFEQDLFDYLNPVSILEQNTNEGEFKRNVANIRGDFELVEGLTVGAFYAIQEETDFQGQYFAKTSKLTGVGRNGFANRFNNDRFNQLFELTGNYEASFGDANLKLLGGYSYQEFINEGMGASGGDFITDAFGYNNLGAAADFNNGLGSVYSYKDANKLIAFFGRANLSFDDTYYFSASLRREGSSRFGTNNKWGNFPGISASVVLSNLADMSGVDNLKVRASYGVTGNPPASSYLSLFTFAQSGSALLNGTFSPTVAPAQNPNPDLRWEKKAEFDIGLDFALMDYKLTGTLDFYNRTTTDAIIPVTVDATTNFASTTFLNIGQIDNTGFEASLSYLAVDNSDFSWETTLNFSTFSTELVELFDDVSEAPRNNLGSPGQNGTQLILVQEGAPIGQLWGPVIDEAQPVTETGAWNFIDQDGDGTVAALPAAGDRVVLGSGLPSAELGWANQIKMGDFDLNFFFRGAFGHSLINTFRAFYEAPNAVSSYNILQSTTNVSNANAAPTFSSYHVEKGDFVRLDNATLGYNVDASNGPFDRIRFYLSGQNLFYITNYQGVDPEVRFDDGGDVLSPGIDRRNTWFRTRTVTFGVNLGF